MKNGKTIGTAGPPKGKKLGAADHRRRVQAVRAEAAEADIITELLTGIAGDRTAPAAVRRWAERMRQARAARKRGREK
jgi:hypothetical protein